MTTAAQAEASTQFTAEAMVNQQLSLHMITRQEKNPCLHTKSLTRGDLVLWHSPRLEHFAASVISDQRVSSREVAIAKHEPLFLGNVLS
jgi:hypothetical protein